MVADSIAAFALHHLFNKEFPQLFQYDVGNIGADGICMMSDWMQAEEPGDSLIAKTIPYAENWKPVADRLWKERQDEVAEARKERFEKYGE